MWGSEKTEILGKLFEHSTGLDLYYIEKRWLSKSSATSVPQTMVKTTFVETLFSFLNTSGMKTTGLGLCKLTILF